MPRQGVAALAVAHIAREDGEIKLELKLNQHKRKPRLRLYAHEGNGVRSVWLSHDPAARIADITSAMPDIRESDISSEFRSALLELHHLVDDSSARTSRDESHETRLHQKNHQDNHLFLGMFSSVNTFMHEMNSVITPRKSRAPDRLQPGDRLRDCSAPNQRRKRKHEAMAESTICQLPACVAQRERYRQTELEKRHKVAELQQVRASLVSLAKSIDDGEHSDARLGIGARAFQMALMEILDGIEGADDVEGGEGGEGRDTHAQGDDEACAEDVARDELIEEPAAAAPAEQPRSRPSVGVILETRKYEGRAAGELSVLNGKLVLHNVNGSEQELWSVAAIATTSVEIKQPNPFLRCASLHITLRSKELISFESSDVRGVKAFEIELKAAVAAAASSEAAPVTRPALAAASSGSHQHTSVSKRHPSQRMRDGRKLREQLLEINRLRHLGKAAEASQLACSLESDASAADALIHAKKIDTLARQRVRELRDTAFSFGKLDLTRQIVQRFVDMPEVRPLLTPELIERRRDVVDGETGRLLIKAAKAFFGELLRAPRGEGKKRGGRRTDDDRNAHAAALAALLPRDLFENRRGRAAMRLLGLTYGQAKRGTVTRGEMEDRAGGWKRIKTAEHFDKVNYAIVDEFWHSEIASDPDNQNKAKVAIHVGIDAKGNRLYDLHERRVTNGKLMLLLGKFRKSSYGARFREATKTKTRPNGAQLGVRQFAEQRCKCIKTRKASQCDCQLCTYVSDNLRRWHKARTGWHNAKRHCIGGKPCDCHIHAAMMRSSEEDWEESVWLAASALAAEPVEEHADEWAAATEAAEGVRRKRARAEQYNSMTGSTEKLAAALLPCSRQSYPDYSLTGTLYREYKRDCAAGNCQKRIFSPREACGWENVFGASDCPIESSSDPFDWFIWSKQQRGTDEEGKPTYSPEWTPHRGTRGEFLIDMRRHVREWLFHAWEDRVLRHSLRLFDDRRSGRYVAWLREQVKGPLLRALALGVVAEWAKLRPLSNYTPHGQPPSHTLPTARILDAVARIAAAGFTTHHHTTQEAKAALERAEQQFAAISNTAVVQCDYAAQIETERSHTATCARIERHNCEVNHVGFGAYVETTRQGRFKNKPPRERVQFKQHVYVFFAFFNAGYKPNARSHNVVQEDIDHFLKHGSFLCGEWFEGGKRLPGGPTGDARRPLPSTLSEAEIEPPVLPTYDRRLEVTDGCACQYDGGTQHHQTAEWRTKTANWAASRAAAAEASAQLAAATTESERAMAANRKAVAEKGIIRVHVKKIPHHGKAGATDGNGNVPTFAIKDAIQSGALLHPGTYELVTYLADARRTPSKAKEAKDGWGAATKYFFGYFDTRVFTKKAVPDCEARGWECHEQHVYAGLCADSQRAERDGPLRTGRMFCSCVPCTLLDFEHCERTREVKRTRLVEVPLPRGTTSRISQMGSLEEWANALKPGMVAGVRVVRQEEGLEGPVWFLLVDSEAFEAPEDILHATAQVEVGHLVVRGRWFELVQKSPRGYRLQSEERIFVVNTMIRLPNIIFAGGCVGKAPRIPRSGLLVMEEDMYNHVLESA